MRPGATGRRSAEMVKARLRRLRTWHLAPVMRAIQGAPAADAVSTPVQHLLALEYRRRRESGAELPAFDDVGFRVFSESDEDGILHYVFSLVGQANRVLVDLGASQLRGSNTANLLVNHGWTGLLVDGDAERLRHLAAFYERCPDTRLYPPRCEHAWITTDNVNDLIAGAGIEGEIDLLAIDLDGPDYWIWKAITVVRPRVVVVEYQNIWGPEPAVTVPYRPDFEAERDGPFAIYAGASLAAFVKLGREKGYRLVGTQRYGYNAFLVRDDVGPDVLPEVTAQACFGRPFQRWAQERFLDRTRRGEWVEV